jgi:mRNA-degrading endonuclease RelE of RelBE toxin-antitoxin system
MPCSLVVAGTEASGGLGSDPRPGTGRRRPLLGRQGLGLGALLRQVPPFRRTFAARGGCYQPKRRTYRAGEGYERCERCVSSLRNDLAGVWSARRGTYRILYRVFDEPREVVVLRMEQRRDVYRARVSPSPIPVHRQLSRRQDPEQPRRDSVLRFGGGALPLIEPDRGARRSPGVGCVERWAAHGLDPELRGSCRQCRLWPCRRAQEMESKPTLVRKSVVVLVTGNGSSGTATPRKAQSGCQPSAGDHSSNRSEGTVCRTSSL